MKLHWTLLTWVVKCFILNLKMLTGTLFIIFLVHWSIIPCVRRSLATWKICKDVKSTCHGEAFWKYFLEDRRLSVMLLAKIAGWASEKHNCMDKNKVFKFNITKISHKTFWTAATNKKYSEYPTCHFRLFMANLNSIKKNTTISDLIFLRTYKMLCQLLTKKEHIPLPLNSFFPIQMYAALSL